MSQLLCLYRRTLLVDGFCPSCNEQHRFAVARVPACEVKIGDDVVEHDGALLTVTSVDSLGVSDRVSIGLASFGGSRVDAMVVREDRLVSVCREVA